MGGYFGLAILEPRGRAQRPSVLGPGGPRAIADLYAFFLLAASAFGPLFACPKLRSPAEMLGHSSRRARCSSTPESGAPAPGIQTKGSALRGPPRRLAIRPPAWAGNARPSNRRNPGPQPNLPGPKGTSGARKPFLARRGSFGPGWDLSSPKRALVLVAKPQARFCAAMGHNQNALLFFDQVGPWPCFPAR